MKPKIRLLVTDLDNTLYDWVTFFVAAFYDMVDVAVSVLEADREQVLDQLRVIHRNYHNSEQPFALLETPTVRERFAGLSREEQARRLDPAFHAFNSTRNRTLRVYPSVIETLSNLRSRGVHVVAHTEATVTNAQFRLGKLGLSSHIQHLYALEHEGDPHPIPGRLTPLERVQQVRLIRHEERKPDPRVLRDIARDVGVPLTETLYVGDSIVRDVGMAKEAGAWAAWAQYGTQFDPKAWEALVRVTHWTADDVQKAQIDKQRLGQTKPDCVLTQYSDILDAFDFSV